MRRKDIDEVALNALVAQGKLLREIAAALGCDRNTLHKAMLRQGIPLPPKRTGRRPLNLPLDEINRRAEEGQTIPEIAAAFGCSQNAIKGAVRRAGLPILHKRGARPGARNSSWKGGRMIDKAGYILLYRPDHPNAASGYVREHRLLMEQKLGRYLTRDEVVHHLDGNPANNHPDNLEVFASNAEHLREELTGRVPAWTEDGKVRIREGAASYERTPETRERMRQGQRRYRERQRASKESVLGTDTALP